MMAANPPANVRTVEEALFGLPLDIPGNAAVPFYRRMGGEVGAARISIIIRRPNELTEELNSLIRKLHWSEEALHCDPPAPWAMYVRYHAPLLRLREVFFDSRRVVEGSGPAVAVEPPLSLLLVGIAPTPDDSGLVLDSPTAAEQDNLGQLACVFVRCLSDETCIPGEMTSRRAQRLAPIVDALRTMCPVGRMGPFMTGAERTANLDETLFGLDIGLEDEEARQLFAVLWEEDPGCAYLAVSNPTMLRGRLADLVVAVRANRAGYDGRCCPRPKDVYDRYQRPLVALLEALREGQQFGGGERRYVIGPPLGHVLQSVVVGPDYPAFAVQESLACVAAAFVQAICSTHAAVTVAFASGPAGGAPA